MDTPFQQSCVEAAWTELKSDWCADVISRYKTADQSIVTMTFAAYIGCLMYAAFTRVLSEEKADEAVRSVMSDFSSEPWYQADVFSRICDKVGERMPKALFQESKGTSMVDLVECANACGYKLMHETDGRLMLKFYYCSLEFFARMKELASSA